MRRLGGPGGLPLVTPSPDSTTWLPDRAAAIDSASLTSAATQVRSGEPGTAISF
jgi:hypothetical protein